MFRIRLGGGTATASPLNNEKLWALKSCGRRGFSGLAGFPSIRDCEAVGRRIGGWLAGGAFAQRHGAALVVDGGAVVFSRPAELSGEKLRALKNCGRRGFQGWQVFPLLGIALRSAGSSVVG